MNQQNTTTKETTIGDVGRGIGALVKKAVGAAKEGAAELKKADLSPAHIKEKVETTTISTMVKYAAIVFAIWCVWKVFGKVILRSFR
jgi:hypothetical protein